MKIASYYRWFWMLELMIVVLLLWILFVAFEKLFLTENRNYIRAEWCVNSTYWQIRNYFDMAATWKWIYTWWQTIYPEYYYMNFSSTWNYVDLNFSTWLDIHNYLTINLMWTWIDDKSCFNSNAWFYLSITWNINDLSISKLFRSDINTSPFLINNDISYLTWYLSFIYTHWTFEKIIGRVEFDRRVNRISYNRCINRNVNESICAKWMNK